MKSWLWRFDPPPPKGVQVQANTSTSELAQEVAFFLTENAANKDSRLKCYALIRIPRPTSFARKADLGRQVGPVKVDPEEHFE